MRPKVWVEVREQKYVKIKLFDKLFLRLDKSIWAL